MTQSSSDPNAPNSLGQVAFIGGGNMARSLIGGLVARGVDAAAIRVADPVDTIREGLQRDFGVRVFDNADEATDGAGIWLLAVKPQMMRQVCNGLTERAQAQKPMAISVAAGITAAQLERWLGGDMAVVRAMPNTPSLLGAGMTGLFANGKVSDGQRQRASGLLDAVGPTAWISDEAQMDAVTAVSGSGPAYVFLLAEAMAAAGQKQGLPAETAQQLANQTLLGAARMLTESDDDAATLRKRVTSPGGTTQAAIETFQQGGFAELVERAVAAAAKRGGELSAAND
jgi:pyrroline-5-carboxylate reductase